MRELAILVVSYNARADLERCLESLLNSPPACDHEIVVIDNASTDGSQIAVKAYEPRVRVIALKSNVGFGRANNVGFRQTESELVLLLNSDTIAPAGAIDTLIRQLRELPDATVVGPRLVNGNGQAELSFGRMMSPFAEVRQKLIQRAGDQRIANVTSSLQTVDWVSGACLLVRRAAAEGAGLFDERFFMYCEDVDFCAAIRKRGGHIYFTPAAEIIHFRGRSAASAPGAIATAYQAAHLAFYEKHHPAFAPVLRLYLTLLGKLPATSADR
jgi:N-acetylglucosaminyl-diphospho-decaprenol L-rhamnosyltransferase